MLPHASLRSASLAGTCIRRCSVAVLSMIAAAAFLARAAVADVSLSEETGSSERANLYSLDEASKNDLLVCCNLQFSMTTSLYWQVRPHEVARLCGRLSVPRASAGPRSNRLLTRTLGSSDVAAPARTARLIRPGKTFHCRPGSVITVTVFLLQRVSIAVTGDVESSSIVSACHQSIDRPGLAHQPTRDPRR